MNFATLVVERAKRIARQFTERERTRTGLARQYLKGEGIEIGALHKPLHVAAHVRYVDRLSRADLRKEYPELAALPVVDPEIIDDGERLRTVPDASQDFIIANHFIEHCADPIGTLRTFAAKLTQGGVIYLAVPDKRDCFDNQRPSTPFEHLEADHLDGGAASRVAHFEEFARFSHYRGKGSEQEVQALTKLWLAHNYSIHFHVWTFEEFGQFLGRLMASYLPQLELVDSTRNCDEGIFILRRPAAQ